jgi:hypothetical protein
LKTKEKRKIVTPDKPGIANYVEKIYKPGDEVIYLEPLPTNHKDWIKGIVQEMKTIGLD